MTPPPEYPTLAPTMIPDPPKPSSVWRCSICGTDVSGAPTNRKSRVMYCLICQRPTNQNRIADVKDDQQPTP